MNKWIIWHQVGTFCQYSSYSLNPGGLISNPTKLFLILKCGHKGMDHTCQTGWGMNSKARALSVCEYDNHTVILLKDFLLQLDFCVCKREGTESHHILSVYDFRGGYRTYWRAQGEKNFSWSSNWTLILADQDINKTHEELNKNKKHK